MVNAVLQLFCPTALDMPIRRPQVSRMLLIGSVFGGWLQRVTYEFAIWVSEACGSFSTTLNEEFSHPNLWLVGTSVFGFARVRRSNIEYEPLVTTKVFEMPKRRSTVR